MRGIENEGKRVRDMDLKGLRYVAAVADAASFTEAAKLLFVAQPALSRKISQLERELGTELFTRAGGKVRLTEAGQVFCRDARQILADHQRLEQDMERFLRQKETLRLICTTNGAVSYAGRMVNALREKYYGVEANVQTLPSIPGAGESFAQILELLRQERSDVLLAFLPELEGGDLGWIKYKCVEPGGLCAFVTRGHPLYGKGSVCTAELRAYTLALPSDSVAPALSRAVNRALGEPPHIIYSPSFADFRVKVVIENHVGIMPASSRTIEDPFLRCLDISDISGGFDLVAVWNGESETAAVKKLLSIL
mgnify:CR=1 FL=1